MLSAYLNQTAEFTPADRNGDGSVKIDSRGRIAYLAPSSMSCRKKLSEKEIITPEGQTIKVNWTYYVSDWVRIDDLLDGRRAQLVNDWVVFDGETIGYKVMA